MTSLPHERQMSLWCAYTFLFWLPCNLGWKGPGRDFLPQPQEWNSEPPADFGVVVLLASGLFGMVFSFGILGFSCLRSRDPVFLSRLAHGSRTIKRFFPCGIFSRAAAIMVNQDRFFLFLVYKIPLGRRDSPVSFRRISPRKSSSPH